MSTETDARIPPAPSHSEAARQRMARFHTDTVEQVAAAVREHPVVVVGMGWNPHGVGPGARCRRPASSTTKVYADGELLGGADEVVAALQAGTLTRSPA